MIPHHEEALDSANILKEQIEREEMKQFAETIITTQSDEIEQMTAWLDAWYPERDHKISYQAIMMSQQLLYRELAEHEEVAFLAREIRNNQRDEIHMMSDWMFEWYGDAPVTETGRWDNVKSFFWSGMHLLERADS